jgi:SAM-dependent methyltransferase
MHGATAMAAAGQPPPRSMDTHSSGGGRRQVAAAAERNKAAIAAVLAARLGSLESGLVLEVASGTGQHAAHAAAALPRLEWQPTEAAPDALESIESWAAGAPNVRAPALLDAAAPPDAWPVAAGACAAVVCINMAHIAPWAATLGLAAGAGRALARGGLLFLYGPFTVDGAATTPSNAAFDATLRSQKSAWGLRDVADVEAAAAAAGLRPAGRLEMPANNCEFSCFLEQPVEAENSQPTNQSLIANYRTENCSLPGFRKGVVTDGYDREKSRL